MLRYSAFLIAMSSDIQKPTDEETPASESTATESSAEAEQPTGDAGDASALMEQMDKLQQELQTQRDKTLRAQADLENFRRRVARDKEDLRKKVESEVIEDLLPSLDNFQIGLEHAAKAQSGADVAKGFECIVTQIQQTLEQRGLTAISPQPGEAFDHHQHEAVGHEPSDTIADHHIIKVMRVGYQLRDRLLRPASVMVSSGPATASTEG